MFLLPLLFLFLLTACRQEDRDATFSDPVPITLHPERWTRLGRHDGYVAGNGNMYIIGGLGEALRRSGKSALTGEAVPLSRLAWVVGPYYTIGNLGYGWEVVPVVDGREQQWVEEQLLPPTEAQPFWGVQAVSGELELELLDVLLPDAPVLLRLLRVRRPAQQPAAGISLRLPVFADERNATYAMFNGREVDGGQVERWREFCGPNLRPRRSVPAEQLLVVDTSTAMILLRGATRALWQEISTVVPPDEEYRRLFPPRALATTATLDRAGGTVMATARGLQVDLGILAPGAERTVAVWIVTAMAEKDAMEAARDRLNSWRKRDPALVVGESRKQLPPPPLRRTDGASDPLIDILQATGDLCRTGQSASGGVWAQPYMYPMYYVRDQYGPFRRFIAGGDYRRAYRVLQFYVAMQNREGIQNAHDGRLTPPDPQVWLPEANAADGRWKHAEVPSYIILMAKDYFAATADLEGLRPLYPRLAYNLRVQAFSENGMQPWATDESYTNTEQTRPRYSEEMTDSQLLFIGAAEFLADLAHRLGHETDAEEFRRQSRAARAALMQRMWLPDTRYFAFARTERGDSIDSRPALDALLRWYWLELGPPTDTVATGNLNAVATHLLEPLRVVPEYQWCTGMDPGYLLYALARRQHPAMHAAARLMERYASGTGLFSEYYEYRNDTIVPTGGTLRPWESSINGAAVMQYLLGLRPDLPGRRLYLQPHLPPGWPGWESQAFDLGAAGTLSFRIERQGDKIVFSIARSKGEGPLLAEVELGGFGRKLSSRDERLSHPEGRADILRAAIPLAEEDLLRLEFSVD